MGRREWYREGRVPLHTIPRRHRLRDRHCGDHGRSIGVKVWVYRGRCRQSAARSQGQDRRRGGPGHRWPGPPHAEEPRNRGRKRLPGRATKPRLIEAGGGKRLIEAGGGIKEGGRRAHRGWWRPQAHRGRGPGRVRVGREDVAVTAPGVETPAEPTGDTPTVEGAAPVVETPSPAVDADSVDGTQEATSVEPDVALEPSEPTVSTEEE